MGIPKTQSKLIKEKSQRCLKSKWLGKTVARLRYGKNDTSLGELTR